MFKAVCVSVLACLVVAMGVASIQSHRRLAEDYSHLRREIALYTSTEFEGKWKVSENVIWEFKNDVLMEFVSGDLMSVKKYFIGKEGEVYLKPIYGMGEETSIKLHKVGAGLVYEPEGKLFQPAQ